MKTRVFLVLALLVILKTSAFAYDPSMYLGRNLSDEFKPDGIFISEELMKENAIKLGQANFKGALTVGETFDSNIFLTPTDTRSDHINTVRPQIFMDLPFGLDERHDLQMLYTAELGSYLSHPNQNYQDQDLAAILNFKLPFGYLAFKDLTRLTSDRAGTEFTNLVKRFENTNDVLLGIEMNKWADEFGYSHFLRRFSDDSFKAFNYTEDTGTSTTYYQLFPKTKALFEYDHTKITYDKDKNRNGDYDQMMLGLKGDLTGKTIGLVKVGYQNRGYDTEGMDGFDNVVAEVGLLTQFSERTRLTVKFIDTAIESVYLNNNYYNTNSLLVELTQRIRGNLSLKSKLGVDRNLYPEFDPILEKKRRDTILNAGMGLEYQAKDWIKANLDYLFKKNNSNIDAQRYEDNQITLSVTLMI